MNARNVQLSKLKPGEYGLEIAVPNLVNVPGSGLPSIRLPLQLCQTVPEAELEGSAEVALQYAQVAQQWAGGEFIGTDSEALRNGWVYVFLNGYLWHEYQVTAGASEASFQDVDLRYWQTKDERVASGVPCARVVFPSKLHGQEAEVQIAFSETQWSWPRICSLGGMNPEDPRLTHKVKNGETLSNIAQQYAFTSNAQEIAELNGVTSDDIQAGQQLKLRESDEPIGDAATAREQRMGIPLNQQASLNGDYSVVYVQDPLGIVEAYNTGMTLLLFNQQQMLAEMKGQHLTETQCLNDAYPIPRPYLYSSNSEYQRPKPPVEQLNWKRKDIANLTTLAQLTYATYLDENTIENMTAADIQKPNETIAQAEDRLQEVQTSLRDTAKRLNKTDVETWLRVNERKAIRQEYRSLQADYIEYIAGAANPYESFDFTVSLETVLEDFAWLPEQQYHKLWSRMADIENHLVIDPNTFDHQYDHASTSKTEREQHKPVRDKGLAFVADVHSGNHRCASWLFPTEHEVDIRSDQPPTVPEPAAITGPDFRMADFQKAVASEPDEQESIAGEKNTFDFLSRFAKVVSAISDDYEVPKQTKKTVELLFRLMKGSGIGDLTGLHLVEQGGSLEGKNYYGKSVVDKFRIKQQEVQHRRERRFLAAESARNQNSQSRQTTILDNNNNRLASTDIALAKPWRGYNPTPVDHDKLSIFEEHGKLAHSEEVIVKATVELWATPNNLNNSQTYRRANTMTQHKLVSHGMRQLPRIMLFMEAVALKEALRDLREVHDGAKEGVVRWKAVNQVVNVLGAIVDLMDAWYGKDVLIDKLDDSKFRSANFSGRKIPIRLLGKQGRIIHVPLIRWIGPFGNTVGAAFTLWESYKLFQKHDTDASIAMAVSALLGLGGAFIGLVGGAVGGTSAMVPIIGWAVFVLGMALAWGINKWLIDSPSESWAEHSPFSANTDHRLASDETRSVAASLQHLQNLIMQPTAKFDKAFNNGLHHITITLDHPGFELDLSTLEFEMDVCLKITSTSATYGVSATGLNKDSAQCIHPNTLKNTLEGSKVTQTVLTYQRPPVKDESFLFHNVTRETAWRFKFRHILPGGVSLPLDGTVFDQDKKADSAWATLNWTTS